MGQALLPGTGFLDLALHAGALTDAPVVEELTLSAPLLLDEDETLALQLTIAPPDQDARRLLTIHSRAEGTTAEWTLHATATLVPEHDAAEQLELPPRPDAATVIESDEFYDRLEQAGIDCAVAFQGVTSVWEHDGEIIPLRTSKKSLCQSKRSPFDVSA